MNYLHLDHMLYIISDDDMNAVQEAHGNCCAVCCKESLQELRIVFLDIKKRYEPTYIEGQHTTPYEQFDEMHKDYEGKHSIF